MSVLEIASRLGRHVTLVLPPLLLDKTIGPTNEGRPELAPCSDAVLRPWCARCAAAGWGGGGIRWSEVLDFEALGGRG